MIYHDELPYGHLPAKGNIPLTGCPLYPYEVRYREGRTRVQGNQNTGTANPSTIAKRGVSHFQAGPLSVTMGICLNLLFVVYDFEVCVHSLLIFLFILSGTRARAGFRSGLRPCFS